jgi:hypothetical protein
MGRQGLGSSAAPCWARAGRSSRTLCGYPPAIVVPPLIAVGHATRRQSCPGAGLWPLGSSIDFCMRRYRSYDPSTGTFLGNDGARHRLSISP